MFRDRVDLSDDQVRESEQTQNEVNSLLNQFVQWLQDL